MLKTLTGVVLLLGLAACSGVQADPHAASPCAGAAEASYQCQVYRYQNAF